MKESPRVKALKNLLKLQQEIIHSHLKGQRELQEKVELLNGRLNAAEDNINRLIEKIGGLK